MTLIKKFGAPFTAFAVFAMLTVSLVAPSAQTASAAVAANGSSFCRSAAAPGGTFFANNAMTAAVTTVTSGSTTTVRVLEAGDVDDSGVPVTVSVVSGGGTINGSSAATFLLVAGTADHCTNAGLGTNDADGVSDNTSPALTFVAPTLGATESNRIVTIGIDANNNGTVDATAIVTVTQSLSATITIAPNQAGSTAGVTATSMPAATGTNNLLLITVLQSNGTPVPAGTAVNLLTDRGLFSACGGGAAGAGSQACTNGLTDGNGQVTATLTAQGSPGTATVTATSGSTTQTRTVAMTGTGSTVEVTTVRATGTGVTTINKGIIRGSQSATTNEDEVYVVVTVKDSNGNAVAGANVSVQIKNASGVLQSVFQAAATAGDGGLAAANVAPLTTGCAAAGATCAGVTAAGNGNAGASAFVGLVDIASAANGTTQTLASGEYTITATCTAGCTSANLAGTAALKVAQAPATVELSVPATVPVNGSGEATATVKDADGNPVADGTVVSFNGSSAAVFFQATTGGAVASAGFNATTVNGVATVRVLGISQGASQIVTVVGTLSDTESITVGTPTAGGSTGGSGGFTGSIAPAGVSLVVYGGGTVAQLAADAATQGIKTISVTVGGQFQVYVVGAPAFVNANFPATLAANTPVVVVK